MGISIIKGKRHVLTWVLALLGFVVAVIIWGYTELTDSSPPHFNFVLWTAFIILCPPSLLWAPLIDVEPATSGFTIMWLVIGVINSALYAMIGVVVSRFVWKPQNQTQ